jgi:hypothetical protein
VAALLDMVRASTGIVSEAIKTLTCSVPCTTRVELFVEVECEGTCERRRTIGCRKAGIPDFRNDGNVINAVPAQLMDSDGISPPQVSILDTTRTNTAENQNGTAE